LKAVTVLLANEEAVSEEGRVGKRERVEMGGLHDDCSGRKVSQGRGDGVREGTYKSHDAGP
jgi:hypothetical protein